MAAPYTLCEKAAKVVFAPKLFEGASMKTKRAHELLTAEGHCVKSVENAA